MGAGMVVAELLLQEVLPLVDDVAPQAGIVLPLGDRYIVLLAGRIRFQVFQLTGSLLPDMVLLLQLLRGVLHMGMRLVLRMRTKDVAAGTRMRAGVQAIVYVPVLQGQTHQQHQGYKVLGHF